ncbi:MAG: hypothetical protein M0Q44_09185 [Methylobacter sp.]|nr:hypothetical protein [Methylobacter sp.]
MREYLADYSEALLAENALDEFSNNKDELIGAKLKKAFMTKWQVKLKGRAAKSLKSLDTGTKQRIERFYRSAY